jgi:hypothetical protein
MAANEKKHSETPPLCFVIGPIGKDGTAERKHADLLLHSLIKHVLQGDEFKYKVKRADEDADPGMIGDRVVTDIIKASLVVADLTDLNPNAFYELGIRHSTELPTIHVARSGTLLPFDNVAHRTIFVDLTDWHSLEQARIRLADSARTIQASGYKVSNPITQANASFKMRQSDDPRDRLLAELQERLASIETNVAKSKTRSLSKASETQRELTVDKLASLAKKKRVEGLSWQEIKDFLHKQNLSFFEELPTEMEINDNGNLTVTFRGGTMYIVDLDD